MPVTCPAAAELRSLSIGTLCEERSDVIISHLQTCDPCQSELASLDACEDTLISNLKLNDTIEDPLLDEAEFSHASRRAMAAFADLNATDKSDTTLPKTIGEYEIVRALGQGGMGRVYLGRHTKLGRQVAIKRIAEHRMAEPTLRARFESEMRTVGGLNHANIVTAHDAREVDGLAVLVTEYIDGMDLSEIVARTGPLSVADACEVVARICDALEYCRSKGIIHRDIKPSNIMVSRDGEVKLLDLGLARLQFDPSAGEFTATGQAIGTADYIAPEQINNSDTIDFRTDIYGLGCAFFKLLVGRAPFATTEYETAFAKMNAHVSAVPPSVQSIDQSIPKSVSGLVATMLAKSPSKRPQSFADIQAIAEKHNQTADLSALVAQAQASMANFESNQALKTKEYARQAGAARERTGWWPLVATGLLGICLGFALGILITVKKPNGETAQVMIPDGARAVVDEEGNVEIVLAQSGQRVPIERLDEPETSRAFSGKLRLESQPNARDLSIAFATKRGMLFISRGGKGLLEITLPLNDSKPLSRAFVVGDSVDVFSVDSSGHKTLWIPGAQVISTSRNSSSSNQISLSHHDATRFLKQAQNGSFTPNAPDLFDVEVRFHDPQHQFAQDFSMLQGIWTVVGTRHSNEFVLAGELFEEFKDMAFVVHRNRFYMLQDGTIQAVEFSAGDKTGSLILEDLGPRLDNSKLSYQFHDEDTLSFKLGESTLRTVRTSLAEMENQPLQDQLSKFMSRLNAPPKHRFQISILDDSDQAVGKPIVANDDLIVANAKNNGGQWNLELELTPPAGLRMLEVTQGNIGKPLGVFIDGELVCSPKIMSAISSKLSVTGHFSEETIMELSKSLVPNIAQPDSEGVSPDKMPKE